MGKGSGPMPIVGMSRTLTSSIHLALRDSQASQKEASMGSIVFGLGVLVGLVFVVCYTVVSRIDDEREHVDLFVRFVLFLMFMLTVCLMATGGAGIWASLFSP